MSAFPMRKGMIERRQIGFLNELVKAERRLKYVFESRFPYCVPGVGITAKRRLIQGLLRGATGACYRVGQPLQGFERRLRPDAKIDQAGHFVDSDAPQLRKHAQSGIRVANQRRTTDV